MLGPWSGSWHGQVDVAIVGAGLSGIGAAVHLQKSHPKKTIAILEARDRMGGTWDLFRYPGIRSDSDMYTLGYSFRPWTNPKAIADGASILDYIRDTAAMYGIDRAIRYGHNITRASFADGWWTLEPSGLQARFLYMCTGYYNYARGYTPEFVGRDRFRGTVIHPQWWPEQLDYTNKRVVVIGSGATAVTLVPALAERASHVTMLQRSPSYILSVPARDKIADWLRARLSPERAYAVTRWKNVTLTMGFYALSRRYPERAKKLLLGLVEKRVPGELAHFTPRYNPWDQRLCLVPDADLFAAIKHGRADVVTDTIDTWTETGIQLASGTHLAADLIVTATGLDLQWFGGMAIEVDGAPVDPAKAMLYKGMMVSDIPNLAFAMGYTNASWTLKADLTCQHVCRLLAFMDKNHYTRVVPRRPTGIDEVPLIDFSSGYILRAKERIPHQGSERPWRLYQNYALDTYELRYARVDDPALELR